MIWFLLAALLPGLYWEQGVETAPALKKAGLQRVYVPAEHEQAWRAAGFTAVAFDPQRHAKAEAPGVQYRLSVASATSVPWIDANGWRFQRNVGKTWSYSVPARKAALAMAEPYAYGVDAVVRLDPPDLDLFARMLAFLRRIDRPRMPALANIGIVDDGSDVTGEVLNLLARRNLLFKVLMAPDPRYDLNVRIGSKEYPEEEAADPYTFAGKLRYQLTDEKRLVRIYGSDVVLVRLTGDGERARLHLINYANRRVNGLRVRMLGEYRAGELAAFGIDNAALLDYAARDGATEFTVPDIDTYAVVDLVKR